MPEKVVRTCSICDRSVPLVRSVTRYGIRREGEETEVMIDLCNEHEEPLLLAPELKPHRKGGGHRLPAPEERGLTDPKTLPAPPPGVRPPGVSEKPATASRRRPR